MKVSIIWSHVDCLGAFVPMEHTNRSRPFFLDLAVNLPLQLVLLGFVSAGLRPLNCHQLPKDFFPGFLRHSALVINGLGSGLHLDVGGDLLCVPQTSVDVQIQLLCLSLCEAALIPTQRHQLDFSKAILDMHGSSVGEVCHLALFDLINIEVLRHSIKLSAHFFDRIVFIVRIAVISLAEDGRRGFTTTVLTVFEVHYSFQIFLLLRVEHICKYLGSLDLMLLICILSHWLD